MALVSSTLEAIRSNDIAPAGTSSPVLPALSSTSMAASANTAAGMEAGFFKRPFLSNLDNSTIAGWL